MGGDWKADHEIEGKFRWYGCELNWLSYTGDEFTQVSHLHGSFISITSRGRKRRPGYWIWKTLERIGMLVMRKGMTITYSERKHE